MELVFFFNRVLLGVGLAMDTFWYPFKSHYVNCNYQVEQSLGLNISIKKKGSIS